MSDTPRSDFESNPANLDYTAEMVPADFARDLERELNAANAYIKRLVDAGMHATQYASDRRRLLWLDAVNSRKEGA